MLMVIQITLREVQVRVGLGLRVDTYTAVLDVFTKRSFKSNGFRDQRRLAEVYALLGAILVVSCSE